MGVAQEVAVADPTEYLFICVSAAKLRDMPVNSPDLLSNLIGPDDKSPNINRPAFLNLLANVIFDEESIAIFHSAHDPHAAIPLRLDGDCRRDDFGVHLDHEDLAEMGAPSRISDPLEWEDHFQIYPLCLAERHGVHNGATPSIAIRDYRSACSLSMADSE